jgi:hypothetical protein
MPSNETFLFADEPKPEIKQPPIQDHALISAIRLAPKWPPSHTKNDPPLTPIAPTQREPPTE